MTYKIFFPQRDAPHGLPFEEIFLQTIKFIEPQRTEDHEEA